MVIGRKIGAVTYIETSAKLADRSVSDAFEVAALAATGRLSKKQTQVIIRLSTAFYSVCI